MEPMYEVGDETIQPKKKIAYLKTCFNCYVRGQTTQRKTFQHLVATGCIQLRQYLCSLPRVDLLIAVER